MIQAKQFHLVYLLLVSLLACSFNVKLAASDDRSDNSVGSGEDGGWRPDGWFPSTGSGIGGSIGGSLGPNGIGGSLGGSIPGLGIGGSIGGGISSSDGGNPGVHIGGGVSSAIPGIQIDGDIGGGISGFGTGGIEGSGFIGGGIGVEGSGTDKPICEHSTGNGCGRSGSSVGIKTGGRYGGSGVSAGAGSGGGSGGAGIGAGGTSIGVGSGTGTGVGSGSGAGTGNNVDWGYGNVGGGGGNGGGNGNEGGSGSGAGTGVGYGGGDGWIMLPEWLGQPLFCTPMRCQGGACGGIELQLGFRYISSNFSASQTNTNAAAQAINGHDHGIPNKG